MLYHAHKHTGVYVYSTCRHTFMYTHTHTHTSTPIHAPVDTRSIYAVPKLDSSTSSYGAFPRLSSPTQVLPVYSPGGCP